jgi:hypothetical protein
VHRQPHEAFSPLAFLLILGQLNFRFQQKDEGAQPAVISFRTIFCPSGTAAKNGAERDDSRLGSF